MSLNFSDIADDEYAINVALDVLQNNTDVGEFFSNFFEASKKLGIEEGTSFKFVCLMISMLGGQQVYLPKEEVFKQYLEYQLIYNEFSGNNVDELAKKYKTSTQNVFRIVKACRKADVESRKQISGAI